MRARTGIVLAICALLMGTVTIGLYGQSKRSARPAPVPAARKSVKTCCGSSQPTRLRIDVFQLTCTSDQLVKLDLDSIGADRGSGAEVLQRLGESGDAKLLVRVDNVFDLTKESRIVNGVRRPIVQDVTIARGGKATPSVNYQDLGFIAEVVGNWRDDDLGNKADIRYEIELSGLTKSGVQVSSGVTLPAFNELKFEQTMTLTTDVPVLIMSSDLPVEDEGKSITNVIVVRVVATRLTG
ncbi:MAG: hypothetical protein JSV03_13550 [Planctomycetota bacterium]|nr:MAG: hypothetical protein JSV03_13550 [Planctomycetota bacterium]